MLQPRGRVISHPVQIHPRANLERPEPFHRISSFELMGQIRQSLFECLHGAHALVHVVLL